MKKRILLLCALLFTINLQAQNTLRVIKGLVTNQAGEALADKNVEARYYDCNDDTYQEILVESTSDENGYYELWMDICDDETVLVIAYCGGVFQSVDLFSFSENSEEINFNFNCNYDYNCDASFSYTFGEADSDGIPFYFEAINPNNQDYFYEWAFLGAVDFSGDATETPLVHYPTFGQYTVCMQTYIISDPYNVICEFCQSIDAGDAYQSPPTHTTSTTSPGFAQSISLFPNPTSDVVQLNFNLLKKEELTIEVENLLGQQIKQERLLLPNGDNQINLDFNNYTTGLYLITVKSSNGSFSRKVVKE